MHIPVCVFDLHLATGAPPAVSLLREDAASRAVQFLKQLADSGQLYTPTGERLHAGGIAYHKRPTLLALPQQSIVEARKAGVEVDDTALDSLLADAHRRTLEAAPEVAVDEDPAPDEPTRETP